MKRQQDSPQAELRQFLQKSKAALLQLLVACAQRSTFNRIIDCPTYPVPAKTLDLGEAVRQLKFAMADPQLDIAVLLAQLYSSVQPLKERKRFGQFFTSPKVAKWVLTVAPPCAEEKICDAGAGTGVFASAIVHSRYSAASYLGVESDPILALCSALTLESVNAPKSYRIWYANFLLLDEEDFAKKSLELPTMVIANPPFVRFHQLVGRSRLQRSVKSSLGITLSSYSGSGSYFLSKAAQLAGVKFSTRSKDSKRRMLFLLPKEAAGAAHAQKLREDLRAVHSWTSRVLHVPDGQTGIDRHASNSVALLFLFEKKNQILAQPQRLTGAVRVDDVFNIKRGISTGRNDFFVLSDHEAKQRQIDPDKWLRKVLPTRIHLSSSRITIEDWERLRQADYPCWLLALPNLGFDHFPTAVREYLREGLRRGLHTTPTAKSLRSWFALPIPSTPPDIFITYFFRNAPRFILNEAGLLNLTNILGGRFINSTLPHVQKEKIVELLNRQAKEWMKGSPPGREYKRGLRKIEPRELSMLHLDSTIFEMAMSRRKAKAVTLFDPVLL